MRGVEVFSEIETELKVLENKKFSGHVKFGVEKGKVVSMSINTLFEPNKKLYDLKTEILNICQEEEFYGSVEFNLDFGIVVSNSWYISMNGEILQSRLRKNQGRKIVVAVKK